MILLYCYDIDARRRLHGYFRDKGVMLEATPPGEYRLRSYAASTSALLIAGNSPPGFVAELNPDVPIISIGRYPLGNSVNFRDYEDPELLELLISYSGGIPGFEYNDVLSARNNEVWFLGYELNLTTTERAVLRFLVQESGRDVAVEEITETCLGDTHLKESNIATHISQINRKAREIGGRNMIFSPSPHFYRIKKYI